MKAIDVGLADTLPKGSRHYRDLAPSSGSFEDYVAGEKRQGAALPDVAANYRGAPQMMWQRNLSVVTSFRALLWLLLLLAVCCTTIALAGPRDVPDQPLVRTGF